MLADAADVLSDQLRLHLERLSLVLKPHAGDIDARFRKRLRKGAMTRQIKALCDITPGAAARILGPSVRRRISSSWWNTAPRLAS